LAVKDRFIPHVWISGLYDKLNQPIEAIFHLEEYAKGCSENKAALTWKEIGERYIKINDFDKALFSFEEAIKHDSAVSVKKLMDKVKKSRSWIISNI